MTVDAGTKTYLERVAEIAPVLAEHVQDNERERRLVEPVVEALREAGMYRMGVPRHYGGSQLDPLEAVQVAIALAEVDASAAWNVGIATGGAAFIGLFGPEVADAVFSDGPDTVAAVSTAAPVFLTPSDDGFVANGQVGFVSGAHEASWFVHMAVVLEDGQMVTDASGEAPLLHVVCVERDAVNILDDWHVSAMRGTGSTAVSLEGVQIPASRAVQIAHLRPGGHFADPEFQVTPWYTIHMEAATSIGIARAAMRDLQQLASWKIGGGPTMQGIKDRERTHYNLGLARALVDGAEAYMRSAMSKALDHASTVGGTLPDDVKVGLQLSAFQAADASARAVDLVCEAAGTSSARLEFGFERYFRDAHFLAKHAAKSVERVTDVGKMLLGLPTTWPPLAL